MTALGMALVIAAAALPVQGDLLSVPSGIAVSFHEMLREDSADGALYRFRFVAPQIAGEGAVPYDAVPADMDALCNAMVASGAAHLDPLPTRIVISLMAEPTVFGEASPQVRQYFEAYSLQDGLCIWEAF